MNVRELIKLGSGTERGEEKSGESGKQTLEWDSETETWGQYFCQLWLTRLMPAIKYELDCLPDSLVLWEEPGWRVVEGDYSVLCLCQYPQSLECVLGWIQGFYKFMSFGGPCSDSRVTSVTQDQMVKPNQYIYQKQGGDVWRRISFVTSQVLPKATREF